MSHNEDGIEVRDDANQTAPGFTRKDLLRRSATAGAVLLGSGAILGGSGLDASASSSSTPAKAPSKGATAEYPGDPAWDATVRKIVGGRTLTIGYTPPAGEEYYNLIVHGAWSQMREYHTRFGLNFDWKTFIPSSHQSVETQIAAIQAWATQKVNVALVCTAGDFTSMQRTYIAAEKKGVHVYQFNMPAELWNPSSINTVSNIGYNNNLQSGYIAGTYIAQKLRGRGNLILIWGIPGHWATSRMNGLHAALKSYPGVKIVGFQRGNYVRDLGLNAAQNLLQHNPHVNAIYGENDEMALGASQAIDLQALQHWNGKSGILVMGADGTNTGYEAIKRGKLTASVNVNPVENGRQAIKAIFYHEILGYSVDKVINVPTVVVDKTNVAEAEAYDSWALTVPNHL